MSGTILLLMPSPEDAENFRKRVIARVRENFRAWLTAQLDRDPLGRRAAQTRFAEIVGTKQATISRWEKGMTPSMDYLAMLSAATGESLDKMLMTGIRAEPVEPAPPTSAEEALILIASLQPSVRDSLVAALKRENDPASNEFLDAKKRVTPTIPSDETSASPDRHRRRRRSGSR